MEGKDFINTLKPGTSGHTPPPVFKKRSESFKWTVLVIIGAIIIFIGAVWVSVASWTPPPKSSDFSNYQDYTKAVHAWANFTQGGNLYGRVVVEVGAMTMVVAGLLGFMDSSIDEPEKRILIIFSVLGLVILVLTSVGLVVTSPYLPS